MGGAGQQHPGQPPSRKVTRKPTENSIGVSKVNWPLHMVPIQVKNLMPVVIKHAFKLAGVAAFRGVPAEEYHQLTEGLRVTYCNAAIDSGVEAVLANTHGVAGRRAEVTHPRRPRGDHLPRRPLTAPAESTASRPRRRSPMASRDRAD